MKDSYKTLNEFNHHWEGFINVVKGNLITIPTSQDISVNMAKLVLNEAALSWLSEYDVKGQWLISIIQSEPAVGERIKDILVNEMEFADVKPSRDKSLLVKASIPAAGAVFGAAVPVALGASLLTGLACALGLSALSYPLASKMADGMEECKKNRIIDVYVGQLEKFRLGIEGIIIAA